MTHIRHMESNLDRCRCGGRAVLREQIHRVRVGCDTCDVLGVWFRTELEAAIAWNQQMRKGAK